MSDAKQNPKAEEHPKFLGRLRDGAAVFEFSNPSVLEQYNSEQAEHNGQTDHIPLSDEPPDDDPYRDHRRGDRKSSNAVLLDLDAVVGAIPEPKLWRATDLKPAAQPRWLARNRIPRAAVSLIIGEEGIGKSLLWVWLVAAITTGRDEPGFGIPARDPGRVSSPQSPRTTGRPPYAHVSKSPTPTCP
jgi:hypothetical protein